ncbi:hypothetical protein TNCV_4027681 [Trichonephila clavipes]|nr:hypothetical protein TNCV_4027681 [Trichonephila clavipes]
MIAGAEGFIPRRMGEKIDHDVKFKQITKTPTKTGRKDGTPKHERSNEAARRRGGKNAGWKTGRPKAANQVGENHPRTQSESMQCSAAKSCCYECEKSVSCCVMGAERVSPLR